MPDILRCHRCGAQNRVVALPANCGRCHERLAAPSSPGKPQAAPVFVTYAHADRELQQRVLEHLKVLQYQGLASFWSDEAIGAGDNWRQSIFQSIDDAGIAVLLVSSAFLSSSFIRDEELPRLLARHAQGQLRIFPILLRDCAWNTVGWLEKLQLRPARALASLEAPLQDRELSAIASELAQYLDETSATPQPVGSGVVLPLSLVARPTLEAQLRSALAEPGGRGAFGVLDGPSGCGKSTAAALFYEGWRGPKAWVDMREPQAPSCADDPDALVVVDNIDAAGQDTGEDVASCLAWLKRARCRTLLVTCRPESSALVLSSLGRAGDPVTRIRVGGYDPTECLDFARATLPDEYFRELSEGTILGLNGMVDGCPLLWQMLPTLIINGQLPEVFSLAQSDMAKLQSRLCELWLAKNVQRDELTERALVALCRIASIGMDMPSLAHVLHADEEAVLLALSPLIRKGFLRRASPADATWIAHAMLRTLLSGRPSSMREEGMLVRYRQLLGQVVGGGAPGIQLLTVIDAWIVGVRQTFLTSFTTRRSDTEAFFEAYSQLSEHLAGLMEQHADRGIQPRWIADCLRDVVDRSCQEVIPLARVVGAMSRKSALFAEILWLATTRPADKQDGYSNAECIRAAAIHWAATDVPDRRLAAERMLERGEAVAADTSMGSTLEMCGLLGGLCRLGYPHWTDQFLARGDYRRDHPESCLVPLLFAVDNWPERDWRAYVNLHWAQQHSCDVSPFVGYYFRTRGLDVCPPPAGDLVFNPNRPLFLAHMSHAAGCERQLRDLLKYGSWDRTADEQQPQMRLPAAVLRGERADGRED